MTASSLASLLVGRTLADRYVVEELIGRGGMSLVYRGRDLRLHRPVALKIISLPATDERDQAMLRQRLRREAAAAARVPAHPNVMQVYDYGTDPALDLDFIAMELLRGRTLRDLLEAGPLTRPEAMRIALESARGLAAGHRAGIIHRDVKPPNIMLTDDPPPGNVRLLDFGIAISTGAELQDSITAPGHSPHSPAYASPEQRSPGLPVNPSSDVYQLALVTREMLIGGRQVDNPSAETRWMDLPSGLHEVLRRALDEAPEKRYPDAAAFAEALAAASVAWNAEGEMQAGRSDEGSAGSMDAGEVRDGIAGNVTPEPVEAVPELAGAPPAVPAAEQSSAAPDHAVRDNNFQERPRPRRSPLRKALAGTGILLAALVTLRLLTVAMNTTDEAPSPLTSGVEVLDEEFRELMRQAGENVRLGAESLPAEFR